MLEIYIDKLNDILFSLNSIHVNLIIISFILIFSITELLKKHISVSGFIASTFLGFSIFKFFHFSGIILLLLYYFICTLVEKICSSNYEYKDVYEFKHIENKSHERDVVQVLANGGLAFFTAIYYYFSYNSGLPDSYLVISKVAFGTVLTESLSDSIASAVGKLSKQNPRSILTRLPVEKGRSGGFTLLGFVSSAIASGFFSILWMLLFSVNDFLYYTFVVFFSGTFGSVLDSVLGASIQVLYKDERLNKYTEKEVNMYNEKNTYIRGIKWMNNDMVNFFSNLSALMLSTLLCLPKGIF